MRRAIVVLLCCGLLALNGVWCTMQNSLAGGGTDVSNPVVVGKAVGLFGAAASNTRVTIVPAAYNVLKDGTLPSSQSALADSSGNFAIRAPSAGRYNLEAVHLMTGNRLQIALDSLKLNDTLSVNLDMIWRPGSIKILFPDAAYDTMGNVYVPGSTMHAIVKNGMSLIDSAPAGTVAEIRYINLIDPARNHLIQTNVSVSSGNVTTVADYYLWQYSQHVFLNTTASGAGTSGNVCSFPVLVRLNSGNFNFSRAKLHGEDLRFAKPDNEPLDYVIDTWDSANAQAAIWVKVDTVYGNSNNQYFVMCWGNQAAVDQSNGKTVFDTADGYRAVWHFDEVSGTVAGEASYDNYPGTYYGTLPRSAAAPITGVGQSFNGINDYIDMGGAALNPGLNNISLSAWIKHPDSGKTMTIMGKSNGDSPSVNYGYILAIDWNCYPHFYMATGGSSWGDQGTLDLMADVQLTDRLSWHHLFVVIDRSGNSNCKIYIDGVDRTPVTLDGNILTVGQIANALPLRIGIEADNGYPWKGSIDEMTVAYTVRSADWVKLCYMNQKADDALVVFK